MQLLFLNHDPVTFLLPLAYTGFGMLAAQGNHTSSLPIDVDHLRRREAVEVR
jgi:hypothetical protein